MFRSNQNGKINKLFNFGRINALWVVKKTLYQTAPVTCQVAVKKTSFIIKDKNKYYCLEDGSSAAGVYPVAILFFIKAT